MDLVDNGWADWCVGGQLTCLWFTFVYIYIIPGKTLKNNGNQKNLNVIQPSDEVCVMGSQPTNCSNQANQCPVQQPKESQNT